MGERPSLVADSNLGKCLLCHNSADLKVEVVKLDRWRHREDNHYRHDSIENLSEELAKRLRRGNTRLSFEYGSMCHLHESTLSNQCRYARIFLGVELIDRGSAHRRWQPRRAYAATLACGLNPTVNCEKDHLGGRMGFHTSTGSRSGASTSFGKSTSSRNTGGVGSGIPSGQMWKPPFVVLPGSFSSQVPQIPLPSLKPR